jgi:hypothetical protein
MILFKVLNQNGVDDNGEQWSLPVRKSDGTWVPGDWMHPVEGKLEMVGMEDHGYRVYDADDVVFELAPRIFEVEIGDEIVDHPIHGYSCQDMPPNERARVMERIHGQALCVR